MNGDAIDRYGEIMHRLGAIEAGLSGMRDDFADHTREEAGERADDRASRAAQDARLKRLEELLTSGTSIARAARWALPLVLALIGAVWAVAEWWHGLFQHRPPH